MTTIDSQRLDYLRRSHSQIVAGFVVGFCGLLVGAGVAYLLQTSGARLSFDMVRSILLLASLPGSLIFLVGMAGWSDAKGYGRGLGVALAFGGLIGMIALALMPTKARYAGPMPTKARYAGPREPGLLGLIFCLYGIAAIYLVVLFTLFAYLFF